MHNFYDRDLEKWKSDDRQRKYDFTYKSGVQISYDIGYIEETAHSYNSGHLRYGRLYHKGTFFQKHLFYKLEYEFAHNTIKDLYIGYKRKNKPFDFNYHFKIGNIKVPLSLNKYSNSKNTMFMEYALNNMFLDGRKLGTEIFISKKIYDGYLNGFGAFYKHSINDQLENKGVDESAYSTRIVFGKIIQDNILSVGFGFANKSFDSEEIQFSHNSESKFPSNKYIFETISTVKNINILNLELLYIHNKYSFQTEYTKINVKNEKKTYDYYGYYLEGSYFLIGKGRSYNIQNSTLEKIHPNRDGALEIAMRYSFLDLNSNGKNGGSQNDLTLGINWYYNKEIKFMFNYTLAYPDKTKEYNDLLQVYQARAMFAF